MCWGGAGILKCLSAVVLVIVDVFAFLLKSDANVIPSVASRVLHEHLVR